jgi:hypothetical protein
MKIQVGQKVRSFDFADGKWGRDLIGERACFIDGIVTDITNMIPGEDGFLMDVGCDRYVIEVELRVFGGKAVDPEATTFYPPVNGTPTWGGKVTNCVEAI